MKLKKVLSLILAVAMISAAGVPVSAAPADIPQSASYKEAAVRMAALGIMSCTGEGEFRPDIILSREQFTAMAVKAAGYGDYEGGGSGNEYFSDVDPQSSFDRDIGTAVEKGMVTAVEDGRFNPFDDVTFAQACTILVRALGFTESDDVQGIWPDNYIDKAKELGLTEGFSLGKDESLAKHDAAVLLDNFWVYCVKKGLIDEDVTTIAGVDGNTVSYIEGGFTKEMELSDGVKYYYKGEEYERSGIRKLLQRNSTIVFGGEADSMGKRNAVVFDPTYSSPLIVKDFDASKRKLGPYRIYASTVIIKNGRISSPEDIAENDVVYQVSDIRSGNKYLLVTDSRISGEITEVLPDRLHPETITIDDVSYGFSGYFNYDRINTSAGSFQNGENITALLDCSGKVLDIIRYSGEYIILGDARTSDTLAAGEILTDKGIYCLPDPGIQLELGAAYRLSVDGDKVVNTGEMVNMVERMTVKRAIDTRVEYNQEGMAGEMTLPEKPVYYYRGKTVEYGSLDGILQTDSAVVFARNRDKTGYAYALVIDPVYGKPSVERDMDVVYRVTDIWGSNEYTLVWSNVVAGIIESFLPNAQYPSSVKLMDKGTFDFGRDMDFNSLSGLSKGYYVYLALGYDGRVVYASKYIIYD